MSKTLRVINALETERRILAVKREQQEADLSTKLNRDLEDVQRQIDFPLGGFEAEQLELQVEQTRRYEDAMRELNKQQAIYQEQLANPKLTTEQRDAINENINSLARQKQLYEEMLPAIEAPITDALASGITDFFTSVIDGSKSAQEAFSDMLRGMAQALIQQGAIMIAPIHRHRHRPRFRRYRRHP